MMFGVHTFPETTRKRGRDDDDEAGSGTLSFGEHRNKRLQCLPLRMSPTFQKRWSAPILLPTSMPQSMIQQTTITPADSDSEEAQPPKSHFSPWSSSPATMCEQLSPLQHELDGDMDMMMDTASPPSSQHLSPPPFHTEPIAPTIMGRMPTPIQPSFASQVRGSGWSAPGPASGSLHGVVNLGHQYRGFAAGSEDRSVPRTMNHQDDWHSVQNRRLPSPISEGEDSCSSLGNGGLSPPGMVLDGGFSSQLVSRLEQSTLSNGPRDVGMMDVEESPPMETSSAPATPSPGRKCHIRSRHTVNNWTWQPGMKKSFSIGYRADCEKCRLKVPGHFNHIIVS